MVIETQGLPDLALRLISALFSDWSYQAICVGADACLFAPVFLFLWGQAQSGWVEADNLQLNAAVGTFDDLALDRILGQLDIGCAFWTFGNHGFLLVPEILGMGRL
jgi:hypothetical protein